MFRGLRFAALGIACVGEVAACPPGTRFSAYQGNGICVILGQGAKAAAQCQVAGGPCPAGTSREHSNNDPSRDYCCPTSALLEMGCRWDGRGPFCAGSCKSDEVEMKRRGTKAQDLEVGEPVLDSPGPFCVSGTKAMCCTRCPAGLVYRQGSSRFDLVCVTPAQRDAAKRAPRCKAGFVWRERFEGDSECVRPDERYRLADGTCRVGYVWRNKFNGDNVCVTPAERDEYARTKNTGKPKS
jgi:hypothetical protein